MPIYRGVGGTNREIKAIYRGVNGVNRKIQRQYRGVNGVNRVVFRDGYGLDEIAQVVFKVYSASAVSWKDNIIYNNVQMKLSSSAYGNKNIISYEFGVPMDEGGIYRSTSIQVSGEYKIKFLDGTEFPLNHQTLTEILPIATMTIKYCMGSFASGMVKAPEITGSLQALDQKHTTVTAFPELSEVTKGLILKKSVTYYGTYPQSSMGNLAVYAGSDKQQYPAFLEWFTDWLGEKNLNHIFLQSGQYAYESDIIIVDARN